MSEIIVLTRDQYFEDLHRAATTAAEHVLAKFRKQDHKAIVSRAEASKLLSKSKSTITAMIRSQRIRTTADGTGIPYTEIERYLNEN